MFALEYIVLVYTDSHTFRERPRLRSCLSSLTVGRDWNGHAVIWKMNRV